MTDEELNEWSTEALRADAISLRSIIAGLEGHAICSPAYENRLKRVEAILEKRDKPGYPGFSPDATAWVEEHRGHTAKKKPSDDGGEQGRLARLWKDVECVLETHKSDVDKLCEFVEELFLHAMMQTPEMDYTGDKQRIRDLDILIDELREIKREGTYSSLLHRLAEAEAELSQLYGDRPDLAPKEKACHT